MAAESHIAERPPRLFTRDEYHAMAQAGILKREERVELIKGRIVTMFPLGPWHIERMTELVEKLVLAYHGKAKVAPEASLYLSESDQPQPDVMVLRLRDADERQRLPMAKDVIVLVEISDSSRTFDLGTKHDLYAANGIPEYWVVDEEMHCIHVFRDPSDGLYRERRLYRGDELIPLPACGEATLRAGDVV